MKEQRRDVQMITVHQWLRGWDDIKFDPKEHRANLCICG